MKRCPECGREYDLTMSFCLDDGSELLYGPAKSEPLAPADGHFDEPPTAILSERPASAGEFPSSDEPEKEILSLADAAGEAPTRRQIRSTDQTEVFPSGLQAESPTSSPKASEKQRFPAIIASKPLILALAAVAVLVAGYFGFRYFFPAPFEQVSSIAVLPFENRSPESDTDYLSEGIAESLINTLTKIADLRVIARSTAFRFRGREGDLPSIARELNVSTILTGSITRRGDSIAIQVDLINASDGLQLWGEKYEGTTSEIVQIQERIGSDISSHLRSNMRVADIPGLAKIHTADSAAYQHYLRGRYFWNRRTPDNIQKAIAEFQSAVNIDPNYAVAYVGLADSYALLPEYFGTPPAEALQRARAAAERALMVDDSLAEAFAVLGLISTNEWNWADAELRFRRSIELDPNYPTARHWYHNFLRENGRFAEALLQITRASELDPLSGIINSNLGVTLLLNGQDDAAVEKLKRNVELDPQFWTSYFWLGVAYIKQGKNEDAYIEIKKALDLSGRMSRTLALYGYVCAVTDRKQEALAALAELEERVTKGEAPGMNVPMIYAGLGDDAQAFTWLERALAERSPELPRIRFYPTFDRLRDDPRFRDLLRRMGLPE